jgi:LacI family transcriptional regulator
VTAGVPPPPGRKATIADVADASGLSAGTISNYLNRPHVVAPATRERIERAIESVGWVPNVAVRTLRRGYSQLIGLVLSDMDNPFFTDVARGVEDAAAAAGFTVVLCNSHAEAQREERYLATLAEHRTAGVLVTPVGGLTEEHYVSLRERHGSRLVLLALPRTRGGRGIPRVVVDDVVGGRSVGKHLLALGHRSFCFVRGPASTQHAGTERLQGLRRAFSTVRSEPRPTVVQIAAPGLHLNDGFEAGRQFLALSPRPTAVFLANDLLAAGMLKALELGGVRVPGDVSVVGYDDLDLARVVTPTLTTVAQPRYEVGQAAVSLLLGQLGDGAPVDSEIVLVPELVVRDSTAAPPA